MRSMVHERTTVGAVVLVTALAGCGTQQRPGSAVARHPQITQHHVRATASRPRRATTFPPRVHTSDTDDEPHAPTAQVSAARPVAKAFFASYLAYLYRRRPAGRVAGAGQSLRAQLAHGHATLTPVERASHPHLARLSITSAGPPVSVVAMALVNVGPGRPSRLTATLEPRRGKWVVVAIAG
jgi:hypothetical protein